MMFNHPVGRVSQQVFRRLTNCVYARHVLCPTQTPTGSPLLHSKTAPDTLIGGQGVFYEPKRL